MKKKTEYAIFCCCIVCMVGCLKNDTRKTSQVQSEEVEKIEEDSNQQIAVFQGLKMEQMEFGNKSADLVHGGYYLESEQLYCDSQNKVKNVLNDAVLIENVHGYLNEYDDRIYYIGENQKGFSINRNGEGIRCEIEENVYQLVLCEKGIIYTDEKNQLWIKKWGKEKAECISDGKCLWLNHYGSYILYSDISDDMALYGYDLITKDKLQIAEYGTYPVVYGDLVYFQGSDGTIQEINLHNGVQRQRINIWAQNVLFLEDNLYFTDGDSIQCWNEEKQEGEEIYSIEEGSIEELWNLKENIIIKEKIKQGENPAEIGRAHV